MRPTRCCPRLLVFCLLFRYTPHEHRLYSQKQGPDARHALKACTCRHQPHAFTSAQGLTHTSRKGTLCTHAMCANWGASLLLQFHTVRVCAYSRPPTETSIDVYRGPKESSRTGKPAHRRGRTKPLIHTKNTACSRHVKQVASITNRERARAHESTNASSHKARSKRIANLQRPTMSETGLLLQGWILPYVNHSVTASFGRGHNQRILSSPARCILPVARDLPSPNLGIRALTLCDARHVIGMPKIVFLAVVGATAEHYDPSDKPDDKPCFARVCGGARRASE